jgi:hypothetical protein
MYAVATDYDVDVFQMVSCTCYARLDVQRSDGDMMEDCCHTRSAQVLLDAGADPNRVSSCWYEHSSTV